MAAREGLVGGLSRGLLFPLPWKQPETARATEGSGGKERKGAERSGAGNAGKPRARGASRVSPTL